MVETLSVWFYCLLIAVISGHQQIGRIHRCKYFLVTVGFAIIAMDDVHEFYDISVVF